MMARVSIKFKVAELLYFCVLYILFQQTYAKKDSFILTDDQRDLIHLVDYGMFDGGTLAVDLAVTLDPDQPITQVYNKVFGLTIDRNKQSSAQIARYGESVNERTDDCALKSPSSNNSLVASFILVPVGSQSVMRINRTNELKDLKISEPPVWAHGKAAPSPEDTSSGSKSRDSDNSTGDVITTAQTDQVEEENNNTDTSSEEGSQLVKREVTTKPAVPHKPTTNRLVEIPLTVNSTESSVQMFQVSFLLTVTNKSAAGLYSIYFHNCAKLGDGTVLPVKVLAANITGRNNKQNTYLSAGDIPEPYLFFSVCVAYVILSFVWLRVLRSAVSGVYKTHYLMLAVCYCKALSALFHGTNFYYIGLQGEEETVWAVIFYISYLMKTIMLFLTVMLVGSGWTFIKHVFSDKEKKLFLVAIPLQLLVYVSRVIMGETEVATKSYSTWHTISIVVDLLCCVVILLPVIWSIRHLNEASQTDGKAALNLRKLRLFKTLYVLVISYIYITRIVILVFEYTLPYQYSWLGDFFTEVTIIGFLILLGYKFRPADDNPYFQIPPDSDDEEVIEMPVTQSGISKDAKRRNLTLKVDSDDPEKQTLVNNGESSHELD